MTEEERRELRELLAAMVAESERDFPEIIREDFVRLDEDTTGNETTEAEILVFGLPRARLHELHVARRAYEFLIGVVSERALPDGSERLCRLLVKARQICPPVRYFDHETAFRLGNDEIFWFQWFGKAFLGLSETSTFSFWHKIQFSLLHLTEFEEIESGFEAPFEGVAFEGR